MKINSKMKISKEQISKLEEMACKNKSHHDELTKMMKQVDAALLKAKINYSFTGGSLLGVHLYEDFIPWDDDIDIAIDLKDLEKMFTTLPKYLPSNLKVVSSHNNKNFQYPFIKIINLDKPLAKKEFGERKEFSYLFIDVTVFTSTSALKMPFSIRFWGKYLWLRNAKINWFVDALNAMFKIIPTSFANKRILKSMHSQKPGNKSVEMFPYHKQVDVKFDLDNVVRVPFRDIEISIINNAEDFLINKYKKWNSSIYVLPGKMITHGIKIENKE